MKLEKAPEKYCYCLLPFTEEFKSIYEDVIKPCILAEGYRCLRADECFNLSENIVSDSFRMIVNASIVIADISGNNPNVIYELGLAHGVQKICVLISHNNPENVPFNLRHWRINFYQNSIAGFNILKEAISQSVGGLRETSIRPFPGIGCRFYDYEKHQCSFGIVNKFSETRETVISSLKEAEYVFQWCGFAATNVISQNHQRKIIIEKPNVRFEFITLDPKAKHALEFHSKRQDISLAYSQKNMAKSTSSFKELLGAGTKNVGHLLTDDIPCFRMVFVDERKLYLSFYSPKVSGMRTMQLELHRTENAEDLFRWFQEFYKAAKSTAKHHEICIVSIRKIMRLLKNVKNSIDPVLYQKKMLEILKLLEDL